MEYTRSKELYTQLIETHSSIDLKGKTTPYTSLNGHMFSFLSKEGTVGLRLSPDDLADVIKTYGAEIMRQHGRIMKEYIEVPHSLLKEIKTLSTLLNKSHDYVSQLKPKPTKSKKKK